MSVLLLEILRRRYGQGHRGERGSICICNIQLQSHITCTLPEVESPRADVLQQIFRQQVEVEGAAVHGIPGGFLVEGTVGVGGGLRDHGGRRHFRDGQLSLKSLFLDLLQLQID